MSDQFPPPGNQPPFQPPYGGQQPQYGPPPGWQPQPPKKRHTLRNVLLSIVGVFVLLIVIGIAASSGSGSGNSNNGPNTQLSNTQAPAVSTTTTTPPPAAPSYTEAQQQAIDAAQQYLSMGNGFSRKGLIQQLDSPDGSGFSKSLAVFAVDHIKVNWYHQAVLSAKGYLSMGGFSHASLVQQLDSPDGEQFTYAQAVYAAKHVGL